MGWLGDDGTLGSLSRTASNPSTRGCFRESEPTMISELLLLYHSQVAKKQTTANFKPRLDLATPANWNLTIANLFPGSFSCRATSQRSMKNSVPLGQGGRQHYSLYSATSFSREAELVEQTSALSTLLAINPQSAVSNIFQNTFFPSQHTALSSFTYLILSLPLYLLPSILPQLAKRDSATAVDGRLSPLFVAGATVR